MPKIYSPSEITNGDYPANEESMRKAAAEAHSVVQEAHRKGDIVSASSFGSLYAQETTQFNRTSDVDWLIVFADLERMIGSQEFVRMQAALRDAHVPFGSPVLSMESVRSGNHLIGPILHGIRTTAHRLIVGEDPVELFHRHGVRKNSREILSHMFASYPRYFFENLCAAAARASHDPQALTDLLQRVTDYCIDTYRSMTVIEEPEDDFSSPITFESYVTKYEKRLPLDALQNGERVVEFIKTYKSTVNRIIDDVSVENDDAERQKIVAAYAGFLQSYLSISKDAVLFCQANIDCFRRSN